MRPCPTCGHETPDGHFCVRCGAPLDAELSHSRHRPQYAAAPGQRRHSPRLISTLFPQLPRHSERSFRIAVALGTLVVLGLGAVRLFGVALVLAAVLLPLLTLLYLYDVDVYGGRPLVAIAWTVAWGLVTGVAMGLVAQALAPTGAALVDKSSSGQALIEGLLVPALGTGLMLAGPLVLLPYRRYDDVLDGATFGSASAVTFASAEALVVGAGVVAGGLRPPGAILPWMERLVALGVASPVLAMSAVGFAAGALWLRFRAPAHDRRALGRLGSPAVALPLALGLVLAGAVSETFLPVGLWLAGLTLLDLVGLLLLREALHVGLLEASGERVIGPEIRCANCGAQTAEHTFCGNCGIALGALPGAREARRGSSAGRLTSGRRELTRVGAALGVITAGAGAALAAAALAAPSARAPRCRPSVPCGTPPPPQRPSAPSPAGRPAYAYWHSPTLGFSLRYVTGEWTVAARAGDRIVLQSSDGISEITVQGAAAPASPPELIAARVSALQGQLLGLSLDTNRADRIFGPGVALVPGIGAVYRGTTNLPQAPDTPVAVALLASRVGRTAVLATVITPASNPGEQATIFEQADDVINSIQVPRA